ncbi:MAG TPA: glycerol-3-phosphate acyltransferase [Candidatus Paceibacterota bacterium]|nr:glycerol-3-phosphate acyltransferase [Verrucomicrobiota bacterium]HSA11132.1 glycerol-3-phosphate acyltransferase [Candidatus Paceibacterota bacterium]
MPWLEQLQSADWSEAGWIALAAYVLGCFTTGYYLVRFRTGQDLREVGSGSVGARNVGRLLGWRGFVLTALGDFGKGALAVWAARHFTMDDTICTLALLAVVAGHVWPVQLCFRGGKGVATALGALLFYDWQLALVFVVLFAGAFAVLRRTILPGLFALACLPLASAYLARGETEVAGTTALAGLVLIAHRRNLMSEFSNFVEHRNVHPKHDSPEA